MTLWVYDIKMTSGLKILGWIEPSLKILEASLSDTITSGSWDTILPFALAVAVIECIFHADQMQDLSEKSYWLRHA
jgi:hypothetical protein